MFFNCRCVCGTEKVVKLTYLKNGHTVSCGCMRGKHLPRTEKDDLTGMKSGLWTVLHQDKEATTVAPRYICQCEYGTVKSVDKYDLKNGVSLHCGSKKDQEKKLAAEKYSKKFRAGEYEQKPADIMVNLTRYFSDENECILVTSFKDKWKYSVGKEVKRVILLEVASHIPIYCKFDICFSMEHKKDI